MTNEMLIATKYFYGMLNLLNKDHGRGVAIQGGPEKNPEWQYTSPQFVDAITGISV